MIFSIGASLLIFVLALGVSGLIREVIEDHKWMHMSVGFIALLGIVMMAGSIIVAIGKLIWRYLP